MAWTGGVTTSDASESYGYSAAGMLTSIAAPELGAQDTVGGVALARSARSAQSSQSAQSAGVETRGTLVTRVGKTSYTYDKLGRVTETVTRRSSLKPLVKRFEYAGSSGQVTGFSSSDAPGVRWVYSYDGLGRRVAKTCLNTDTGEIVSRQVFTYVGNDLVAEHTTTGDASGVVGRVWVQDPGTGELVGQINLTTNNNDAAGVDQWSQSQVDAVFYALVADLAGAPQELIDTEHGSVAGRVTQSLFGRRTWSGVDSPVLFAGQYEDAESGWVYNRFRFYDPAGGVYGSQDPLGVGPNVGTPQGYVHNPITWADALGLQAHQIVKNAAQGKASEGYANQVIKEWVDKQDGRFVTAKQVRVTTEKVTEDGTQTVVSRLDNAIRDTQTGEVHLIEIKSGQAQLTSNQNDIKNAIENGNAVQLGSRSKASDLSTATLPIEKGDDITGSFNMFRGNSLNDFQQGMAGFLDSLAQG